MRELGCNVPRGTIPVGTKSKNSFGSYLTVLCINREVGKGMYNVQLDSGLSKLMAGKEIRNGVGRITCTQLYME